MILLASVSDLLRVVTSAAVTVDVHASWVDMSGATVTPGRTNTLISTATTTTVVGSPAASTYRTVKGLTIRNRHASTAVDVTVIHSDGTNIPELMKATLAAGEALHYDEGDGWHSLNSAGLPKTASISGVAAMNMVVLAADVTDSSGANTLTDLTGLSFPVVNGQTYFFRLTVTYTSAVTTTGAIWTIGGPAMTFIAYKAQQTLTATTEATGTQVAINLPAAAPATSLTAGNIAVVEGIFKPSADGTAQMRFATEVDTSAVVARAGSLLEWARVL